MYLESLNNIILQCLSDDEHIRNPAYVQLCQLENEPNFAYQLFQLYITSSDCIKRVALLACINALSRNISKSNLSEFKANLLSIIFKISINKHNLAEAKHLIVLLRKIVRQEYPHKWPELLNAQIESLKNVINLLNSNNLAENSIFVHLDCIKTSVFVSNYIIKEQVSKRLLRDRNEMYKITQALFALISEIWYKFNEKLLSAVSVYSNNYNAENLDLINSLYQASTLMDSLLLRLLYYGQKAPYLDGNIIKLISSILKKITELFKSTLQCEYLHKNIRKSLKFITHLIEHEALLFSLVDLDTFLLSLVDYLSVINNSNGSEKVAIVYNGLLLFNGIFGSFAFNQESFSDNLISNIENINPNIPSDSIKLLKNQCSLRLAHHLRNGGQTRYVLWLLNNFIKLSNKDLEIWNNELSESFYSLNYLPQSIISNAASSIITSMCSFKQNIPQITAVVMDEIAKCSFNDHLRLDATLHLISSSAIMISKYFDHDKLLEILNHILLVNGTLLLKLRSLNVLNNIIKNYMYSEDQGLLVLNILIQCLSSTGPMDQVIKIASLSPIYNFYVKTNEYFYWQKSCFSGITPSEKIIQLATDLFISGTHPGVRAKCMNLVCKLVVEIDVHNSDTSAYKITSLLQNVLEIYKQSNWEVCESILHLSLALINSFDLYKCYTASVDNLHIYHFLVEVVINTMDFSKNFGEKFIKHVEYQELFHSVWVSLLRILPSKLDEIDNIVVDKLFTVFNEVVAKNYDLVHQPVQFHDVIFEYFSLAICIFESCTECPNSQLIVVAQKVQISHLLNIIEQLISNNILAKKFLALIYYLPNCSNLDKYHHFSYQILDLLWNSLVISDFETWETDSADENTLESLLPPIVSYLNHSLENFNKSLSSIISSTDRPKERLSNLIVSIERKRLRDIKFYGFILAQKIVVILANLYPALIDYNEINKSIAESIDKLVNIYKESDERGSMFVKNKHAYSIGGKSARSDIDDIKTPFSYRIYNLMDRLYTSTIDKYFSSLSC